MASYFLSFHCAKPVIKIRADSTSLTTGITSGDRYPEGTTLANTTGSGKNLPSYPTCIYSPYVFKGWFSADGTQATPTTKISAGACAFHAHFTTSSNIPIVMYGGDGLISCPSDHAFTNSTTFTLSSATPSVNSSQMGWSGTVKYWRDWRTEQLFPVGATGTSKYALNLDWMAETTYPVVWYNLNGGTASVPMPYHGNSNVSASLYVTLTDIIPIKTGYTFKGWSTSPTASTPMYASNEKVTFTDKHIIILYAVWQSNSMYTITYNRNSSSATGGPTSQTTDSSGKVTISSSKPTWTGYTFLGWADSSTATSAAYTAGSQKTFTSNKTLYAVWQGQVTYNANSGSGAPSAQTFIAGKNVTLSSTAPTRTGYTFKGWSTSSSATSPSYYGGSSYSFSGNTTLYAVWAVDKAYTITFNRNGAGASGGPSSQTANSTTGKATLSSSKPSWTGYTFLGWSESSSASSASYYAGNEYTFSKNTTLYAVWQGQVRYNANNGSGAPGSQNYIAGKSLTISTTKPTRSGYNFKGWSESSNATTPTHSSGGSYYFSGSPTLYAVWAAKCTLTYNTNIPGNSQTFSTKEFEAGTSFNLTTSTPTYANHTFVGWSTSSTATSASYSPGASVNLLSDTTLYAVWRVVTLTVTIDYQAGTSIPSGTLTCDSGKSVTLPAAPNRAGYEFVQYQTALTGTFSTYMPGQTFTPSSNCTLYAKWTRVEYVLTFNASPGTFKGTTTKSKTFTVGSGETFQSRGYANPVGEYKDATFSGWFDENGVRFSPTTTYTSNKAFSAQYTGLVLWDCVPIMIASKPVAARPYIYTNGEWVPASPRVYSELKWNRVACPSEYAFTPERISVAHMPYQDGVIREDGVIRPKLGDYFENEVILGGVTSATKVGMYRLTVTPRGNRRWSDGSAKTRDLIWEAPKLDETLLLTSEDVPVQTSIPMYTGAPITPEFTYNKSKMRIEVTPQTEVGEYEIDVTALGDYEWDDDM